MSLKSNAPPMISCEVTGRLIVATMLPLSRTSTLTMSPVLVINGLIPGRLTKVTVKTPGSFGSLIIRFSL